MLLSYKEIKEANLNGSFGQNNMPLCGLIHTTLPPKAIKYYNVFIWISVEKWLDFSFSPYFFSESVD